MVQKDKYTIIKDLLKFLFIRGFVLCRKESKSIIHDPTCIVDKLDILACCKSPLTELNKYHFDKIIIELSKAIDGEFILQNTIKCRKYIIMIEDIKLTICIKHDENGFNLLHQNNFAQIQSLQLLRLNQLRLYA